MDRRKFIFSSLIGAISVPLVSLVSESSPKEPLKEKSPITIKCYRNVRTGDLYHYKGEVVQIIDLYKESSNDYVILTLLPAKNQVDIGGGKGMSILYHYYGDLDLKFYGYTSSEEQYRKSVKWVTVSERHR